MAKSACGLLLLLMVLSGYAFGEIYQWRDEQGRLHFGDKPRTADAKTVELKNTIGSKNPAPTDKDQQEQQRRLLKAFDKKRQRGKQAAAKAAQTQAQTRQQCERARRALDSYQNSGRLFVEDADGNRDYYSAEERDAKIARLQQAIDRRCR